MAKAPLFLRRGSNPPLPKKEEPDAISPHGAAKTHVHVEKLKVNLENNYLEVIGEYHFYNDLGKEVRPPQPAKIMKLNFQNDPNTQTVCFQLTREALHDIVDKLNGYPVYYSYDEGSLPS